MNQPLSIDLKLPSLPDGIDDPKVFAEVFTLYNSIRNLAEGVDDYTEGGMLAIRLSLAIARKQAELNSLREEVAALKELILNSHKQTNWRQPGELGEVTPNTAVVTSLTAEENVLFKKRLVVKDNTTVEKDLAVTGKLNVIDNTNLADTVVNKFGANGKPAVVAQALPAAATDVASTQTLVNAIRNILITFGLGV